MALISLTWFILHFLLLQIWFQMLLLILLQVASYSIFELLLTSFQTIFCFSLLLIL